MKTGISFNVWAVEYKSHPINLGELFYARGDALRHMVNNPEDGAEIVPATVTVSLRSGE